MTHTDAAIREKISDYFVNWSIVVLIRGKAIVVGSPKLRNLLPGVSFEQAWELACETFAKSIKRRTRE